MDKVWALLFLDYRMSWGKAGGDGRWRWQVEMVGGDGGCEQETPNNCCFLWQFAGKFLVCSAYLQG